MKSIILALSALIIMAGCSGGGGSSDDGTQNPPPGATSGTLSGKVVDGYIANGNVFADVNGNSINDAGDIVTTTDGDGNVVVPATEVPFNTYIYVTDGTDLATNRPFHGRMSAYYTGTSLIVSPLTTMTATLIKSGKTPEEATASVATALGIPADKVDADPMEDTEVFFASERIVSAVAVFAEHSSDKNVSVASFEAAVAALADNEMDFNATANELGVPAAAAVQAAAVDDLVKEVETKVQEAIAGGDEPNFEDVQSVVVSTLDNVIEQIEADPIAVVEVPEINTVNLLYDATNCVTFEKIKGSNTAENNIMDNLDFTGTSTCAQQDDGNVSFSWSSSDGVIDGTGNVSPHYVDTDVVLTVTISALDSDGSTVLATAEKTFSLHAPRNANRAPVAENVSASVNEDEVVLIDANASDVDGDTLSLEITQAPTNGVAVVENGKVKYTPNANFNGTDEVGYTVSDNWTSPETSTATMTITVNAVDDAPVLQAITNQSGLEDSPAFDVDLNATDVDGDAITFVVSSSNEALVTVSEASDVLTLTPQLNANGSATITVVATANGVDATQTFSVTLTPVDDAPVLDIISIAPFDEEATVVTPLVATDVDGDAIVFTASDYDATLISVTIIGNEMHVTGLVDKTGITDINVTATANGVSDSKTVGITVNAVDDAPVFTNIAPISFNEDGASDVINLVATDVDNDDSAIVFSATDFNTSLVSVSVSGTTLTVTGLSNAFGTTELNVTATSGLLSASQIVSVTVASVNDVPRITVPSTYAIAEDTSTGEVYFSADDNNDNGAVTVTATSSDQSILADENITLVVDGSDSTFVMTPMPNANGDVTVTFTVDDGELTATDSVVLSISPVNDAPTADDFSVAVVTSTTKTIDLASHINDVDGDALTLASFDALSGLSNSGTEFTYVNDGTEGTFLVNYTIDDGHSEQASGVMTLIVSTTPVIPVAVNDTATVEEDDTTGILIDVLANDTDATSVAIAAQGSLGVTTVEGTQLRYIPNLNENGTDSVTYTAISDTGDEMNATVTITITDVNDAPTIQTVDNVTVDEDTPTATFALVIDDVDNDVNSLIVTATTDAEPYVTFSSATSTELVLGIAPNYNGVANVTLSVSDGNKTAMQVFSLTVNQVYDTPNINKQGDFTVNVNEQLSLLMINELPLNESYTLTAESNDTNIATISVGGANGEVVDISGINLGTAQMTVHAENDNNSSLTDDYVFKITVVDPNAIAPIVDDSAISMIVDTIQINSVHADIGPVVFSTVVAPTHGSVVWIDANSGQYKYTPASGYVGTDSFTYKANNGLDSNIATVSIDIHLASNNDEELDVETPMSISEFNSATALTNYNVPMYSVWKNYNNGQVELDFEKMVIKDSPQVVVFDDNDSAGQAYTLDTDNATIILDFDGNSVDDIKVKYLGTVDQTTLENDLNITLPTGSSGYKLAVLHLTEEYDDWGASACADYDENGCVGGTEYSSLDSMMAQMQPSAGDPRSVYFDGYEFMFADGSAITDMTGTIVRVSHDENGSYVVTNTNAGTWEVVDVSGTAYLRVSPSVYGMTKIYTYHVDTTVMEGEYRPANRASLEYKFNEIAQLGIANLYNAGQVNLPKSEPITQDEFDGFTGSSTISYPILSYTIWAWNDAVDGYQIDEQNITITSATTLEIGGEERNISTANNVVTVKGPDNNPFVDAKAVEEITDANELASIFNVDPSAFGGSPLAYKTIYINYHAKFEADGMLLGVDDTTSYSSLNDYVAALQTGAAVVDYTPDGNVINIQDNEGNLALFDSSGAMIKSNIGTYKFITDDIDGASVNLIVIKINVPRSSDFNAVAVSSDYSDQVSRGHYAKANTGAIEYRFDTATVNAVVSYLNTENGNENPIDFGYETPVSRAGFVGQNLVVDTPLYGLDSNATALDSITFHTGGALSFNPSDGATYTWSSTDGITAVVTRDSVDITTARINGTTLNAEAILAMTGLYMPAGAQGYSLAHINLVDNMDDHDPWIGSDDSVAATFDALIQNPNGGVYLPELNSYIDFSATSSYANGSGDMVTQGTSDVIGSWELVPSSAGELMVVTLASTGESVTLYVSSDDNLVHYGEFTEAGTGVIELKFNDVAKTMVENFIQNATH